MLTKSRSVLAKAMREKQLTRKELYAAWEQAGTAAHAKTPLGSLGSHLVTRFGMEGLLCFGPRRDKQPTFALLDEWAPNPRRLEGDEALAELAVRYFRSHGPATKHDFAWWAGLTDVDARRGIEIVGPALEKGAFADRVYWSTGSMPAADKVSQEAYLLPYIDEYTVAYKDRSALADSERMKQIVADSPAGILEPVIVVDGQVVGVWKRTIKKDKVVASNNTAVGMG